MSHTHTHTHRYNRIHVYTPNLPRESRGECRDTAQADENKEGLEGRHCYYIGTVVCMYVCICQCICQCMYVADQLLLRCVLRRKGERGHHITHHGSYIRYVQVRLLQRGYSCVDTPSMRQLTT